MRLDEVYLNILQPKHSSRSHRIAGFLRGGWVHRLETRLGPSSRCPGTGLMLYGREKIGYIGREEAGKAWYVTEELKKMKRRREIHRAGLRAFVQDGEIMV